MYTNSITIAIILGAQWRNESDATKDKYRAEADAIRKQHAKDHPDYSYQPRKSGDKKRRMTDKKAAGLADIGGTILDPAQARANGQYFLGLQDCTLLSSKHPVNSWPCTSTSSETSKLFHM